MSQFVQSLETRKFLSVTAIDGSDLGGGLASDTGVMYTMGASASNAVKAASTVNLTGKTYTGSITSDGLTFTYTIANLAVNSQGKITGGTLTIANTALNISKAFTIGTATNSQATGTLSTKGVFAIKIAKGQTVTAGAGNAVTLNVSGVVSGKANLAATTPDAKVSVVSNVSFSTIKNGFKLSAGGKADLNKQ